MRSVSIIRKSLALAMLLLFTLSVTPRIYLHDLVADHQDYYGYNDPVKPTVSQSGFQCDCQDQVVSTPYLEMPVQQSLTVPLFYTGRPGLYYSFFYSAPTSTTDLRGPPSLSC
ncbi:MAG TPA: hypothetical protein VFR58_07535 [Flavisolibacter sp.]|nr:hypothetical protein [Flavisolibacter sp.]